jgi:hypothetical protein
VDREEQPVASTITGDTIPLTWAQQAWLAGPPRLDEHDAWRHDMDLPVPVPPGLTADLAATVTGRLVESYPPLRARLCRAPDGTIRQQVSPPDDPALADTVRRLAVCTFDRAGGDPADQLCRQVELMADRPAGPNMALMLPARPRPGGTATLRLAHAFVDRWAADALVASFAGLTRSTVDNGRPSTQDLLYRRIAFERGAAGAELSARAVRHLMRTAAAAVRFGLVDTQRPVAKGDVPACHSTSTGLFQLLAKVGSGSPLSRAAVLLGLALVAYCGVRDRSGAWLAVNVANRRSADDQAFVGMTIQNGWLLHRCAPGVRFADLVRELAGRLVDCVRHGRYDPDRATAELDRHDLPRLPNFYFNYAEGTDARRRGGRSPLDGGELDLGAFRWNTLPAAGAGSPLEFNAYAASDAVGLTLKYDDTVFTRAAIGRLIGFLRAATTAVLTDPDVPVMALLAMA